MKTLLIIWSVCPPNGYISVLRKEEEEEKESKGGKLGAKSKSGEKRDGGEREIIIKLFLKRVSRLD